MLLGAPHGLCNTGALLRPWPAFFAFRMLPLYSSKLAEQLLLPLGQMGGGFDHDMHNLIPASFAPQGRHAAPTQRQPVTSLGATGDSERLWTVERWHFNIGAQRCLGKGNRDLAMHLRAVTLEE